MTADRQQAIMRRAQMYAAGELTLEDFMLLEKIDTEAEEEAAAEEAENKKANAAEELRKLYGEEQKKEEAAKRPPAEKVVKGEKHTLSVEEWKALNIAEQNKLYNEHPAEIGKLIRGTVNSISYSNIDVTIPRYTVEEWKKLSLAEMQYVYDNDREQALELMDASRDA